MRLYGPKPKKFWRPGLILPSGAALAPSGITFQAFATENAGLSTATFSAVNFGTASANRVIAIGIGYRMSAGSSNPITSVTIGGISATQVPSAAASSVSTATDTDIWYAAVPTGTSGTVVVNYTAANVRSGIYAYAVLTSNPSSAAGAGIAGVTATTVNTSITVPTSGVGLAIAINRNTGNSGAFTNALIDADNQLAGAQHDFFCGRIVGTGSITVTATSSPTGNDMALSLAAWGP